MSERRDSHAPTSRRAEERLEVRWAVDCASEETFLYAELTAFRGAFRRLPQLWNIVSGDFRWIGTPPIAPSQAAQLTTEFERLCLRGPIGLVSPEGRIEPADELTMEAIAHASCYAVNPHWRSKGKILAAALTGRRRVKELINLASHL